jgi:hypothetical protein
MRTRLELTLSPHDRLALRALTAEERQSLVEQLLEQMIDELQWMVALESARDSATDAVLTLDRVPKPTTPQRHRRLHVAR